MIIKYFKSIKITYSNGFWIDNIIITIFCRIFKSTSVENIQYILFKKDPVIKVVIYKNMRHGDAV